MDWKATRPECDQGVGVCNDGVTHSAIGVHRNRLIRARTGDSLRFTSN